MNSSTDSNTHSHNARLRLNRADEAFCSEKASQIKLPNSFISLHIKGYYGQSWRPAMRTLQKEMWSDEATVTSEQLTFYLDYHSQSAHGLKSWFGYGGAGSGSSAGIPRRCSVTGISCTCLRAGRRSERVKQIWESLQKSPFLSHILCFPKNLLWGKHIGF